MKSYFMFMTSGGGRIVRFGLGIAIFALGYFYVTDYPGNWMVMSLGGLASLLALFNVSLFGAAFGYSVSGSDLRLELNDTDDMPIERTGRRTRIGKHILHVLNYVPNHPKGWAVLRQDSFHLSH